MSFILDALRKSEADRAQRAAPGLADVRYEIPQPEKSSKWMTVVAVLLIVNAALVAFVLLDDASDTPEPAAPAVVAPAGEIATPAVPSAPADAARVRPLAEELIEPPVRPRPVTPTRTQAPAVVTDDAPRKTLDNGLPSYQQLVAGGTIALPDLHLDMHVFSPDPATRFIFVNMTKYKERQQLSEGPTVEEITETGVVLDFQGIRFFLDRE
jgi:general secretion pathway protein B